MKICYVCSAGGHFTEALRIFKRLDYDGFFITFESENLKGRKEKIYNIMDFKRNPLKFIFSLFQTTRILLKERPDVILSTGAGLAVPCCLLGKVAGCKVIHLEIGCNVSKPSLSGRMIYPIADLFIVEWKKLLHFYPKAKYGGLLI